MRSTAYRIVTRPPRDGHDYSLFVFDGEGRLHEPLTIFARSAAERVSRATAQTYVRAIVPFFAALDARADLRWDGPIEQVRLAIEAYLIGRLQCQVRLPKHQDVHDEHSAHAGDTGGFQLVVPVDAMCYRSARVFLSGLKLFYRIMEHLRYCSGNPLARSIAQTTNELQERAQRRDEFPLMPLISGVRAPDRTRRLSDSYFVLHGEEWQPQIIDDPSLPAKILEGGRRVGWGLCQICVTRILFETGARVSEVIGLTLGDYEGRILPQEASAFSKGSQGRRVKFLRFSNDTTKLLLQYIDTERRQLDPQHATLEDYRRAAQRGDIDLMAVSLFLTSRGTPLTPKTFRDRHWHAACVAVGIEADIHQARHWYVTQAVRQIHAGRPEDIEQQRQFLIKYMAWRSERTIAAYEHYFDAAYHADVQDQVHALLQRELEAALDERQPGQSSSRHDFVEDAPPDMPLPEPMSDDAAAFASLRRLGGMHDGD